MGARVLAIVLHLTSATIAYEACSTAYYKIGCYKDSTTPRIFPNLLLNARHHGAENNPGYSIVWNIEKYQEFLSRFICDCAKSAASSGTTYFGIQYYAECWSGAAGPEEFVKLGSSESCINSTFGSCQADADLCSGVQLTNMIYFIPHNSVTTTKPATATIIKTPATASKLLITTVKSPTTMTKSPTTTKKPQKITTKSTTTTHEPPRTAKPPTTTTKPPRTTTKASTMTTKSPKTTTKSPKTTIKPPTTTVHATTEIKPSTSTVVSTESIEKPDCMKKADILIALDVSSSISLAEFEKRKKLLANFVARFSVNANEVHFSLLHYNHYIHTDFTFEDPWFYNINAVQERILEVALLGGATLTQNALDEALTVFSMTQYGARQTSKKILIIVTDGYTYGGEETLELPSLRLQLFGVHIVAVGFGERTNLVGLNMISSNVLTFDDMFEKTGDESSKYLDMLEHAVCASKGKTIQAMQLAVSGSTGHRDLAKKQKRDC